MTFDLVADSSQCATVCTSSADAQVRFAGYTYSSSSSDQFCDCFFVGGLPTIASFTECTGLPGCYVNATSTGSATDQSGDECYKSSLFPWDVQFESIGFGTCLSQNSNGVGLGATDLIEHQYLSSTSGDCELACKFISVEASDNLVAFSFGVDLESGLNSCKCHFEKGFLTSAIPGGGNCPDDVLSCEINGSGAGPITGTDNDANFECFRNYNFGVAPTGNPTSPPTCEDSIYSQVNSRACNSHSTPLMQRNRLINYSSTRLKIAAFIISAKVSVLSSTFVPRHPLRLPS